MNLQMTSAGREKMFSNRDLALLILPLAAEQCLNLLVGVADSMMVSYAGEAAMSGVALVDMYAFLISTLLAAAGGGGAVIVSQYLGHKDREQANLSAGQLLLLSAIISTTLMIFTLAAHKQILHLFYRNVEPDVMAAASRYMVITALSYPCLGIYNASAALFRSMKKTVHTMAVSMVMNAINVVGNAVGIFVLHAGVAGVAVPTLIARMTAGFLMTGMLFSGKHQIRAEWKNILAWKADYIRRILSIAIPNGIENGLFSLGRLLVISIVALFGTTQIAASSAALSVGTIAIIIGSAVNLAIVTVVGQCVGAMEYDQAEYYMKKLMRISYAGIILLVIPSQIFLTRILGLYDLSAEAKSLAAVLITIHNVGACFIHPTSFNLANGLRATGDARYTMMVGMVSMVFFRVGAAVLFGIVLHFQVMGVWFAMMSDWACRSVLFLWRLHSGKWRNYRAI